MFSTKKQQQFLAWNKLWGGGGSRNPRCGILAPTQIYTVMTIKTSKTGRTVVKCSEKQFLCVLPKTHKTSEHLATTLTVYDGFIV